MASETEYWRTRPGGLSSVRYEFPNFHDEDGVEGFAEQRFGIRVVEDPGNTTFPYDIPIDARPSESKLGYFWANQFGFVNGNSNGVDGYIGIQTVGSVTSCDPKNRNNTVMNTHVCFGRIAIFSIWNAFGGEPGPIASNAATFGHEGRGWSCSLLYPWQQDVLYQLRVERVGDNQDGANQTFWRGVIKDTTTHTELVIGTISVDRRFRNLHRRPSCFTEYYTQTVNQKIADEDQKGNQLRVCQYMPRAVVEIYPPTADYESVSVDSMSPENYGKCKTVSHFERLNSSGDSATVKPAVLLNTTGVLRRTLE